MWAWNRRVFAYLTSKVQPEIIVLLLLLLKVEYRPCVIPSNCWDLIREFMQGFMGSHVTNIIPPYFTAPSMMAPNQNKQNDIYQPIDTVQQYLEHFSNYRKLNNPPPIMGMRNWIFFRIEHKIENNKKFCQTITTLPTDPIHCFYLNQKCYSG